MPVAEHPDIVQDRRRPLVPALHQPIEPARIRAHLRGRLLLEQADVVRLCDRTVLLEVRDATLADALGSVSEVFVSVDLGGASTTLVASGGHRWDDRPTACRVELVLHARR